MSVGGRGGRSGGGFGSSSHSGGVSYGVVGKSSTWVKCSSMRARQQAVGVAISATKENPGCEACSGRRGRSLVRPSKREVHTRSNSSAVPSSMHWCKTNVVGYDVV